LFIDADEALEYAEGFKWPPLDRDFYYMPLREASGSEILKVSMIRSDLNWKWKGVIHETLECPNACCHSVLEGVRTLYNVTLGARSKHPEKFLRDANILKEALKLEPENSRYLFYLGQSYMNAGEKLLAIEAYQKRIAAESGDMQETYLALYHLGLLLIDLDPKGAIEMFQKAYACRPTRAEPLFQMAALYRQAGAFEKGFQMAKKALKIERPKEDVCVDSLVYEYQSMVEYTYCAFFAGRYKEGIAASEELLKQAKLPENLRQTVMANLELAKQMFHKKNEILQAAKNWAKKTVCNP
jgi:tetratricopeptide (TPR) repeat protein